MRAVKSEEVIEERRRESGYHLGRILSADNIGICVNRKLRLGRMSTPAVMTANLTKLRQTQFNEKLLKKKDFYRNKSKKDLISTDQYAVGDNLEVCSPYENTTKECKELVRPSTAVRNRNYVKDQLLSTVKEISPQNGEVCKRCSSPPENKPVEKFDEGFYDDEQNPKINIIEEVKELIRKSEVPKKVTSEVPKVTSEVPKVTSVDLQNDLICQSWSSCNKPKKRIWVALLVWLLTFTGALACYFALFVYTYKYEPFYSRALELLGVKKELPPPPPTMKEELFNMIQHISNKLYSLHLSLVEIVSLPFQNKS